MIRTLENLSFQTKIECEDDDIFDSCNFSQQRPHTEVSFTGKNIIVAANNNTTNCDFIGEVKHEGISYHTPKSLDELAVDEKAKQDAIVPEKIFTENELVKAMVIAKIAPATIDAILKNAIPVNGGL